MGDSDDEYDRRGRRDKFRRERSDYQERRDDRGRRDDWNERDRSSRRDYRDYDPRNRRERYSPVRHDISPPMKRMRRDWEDRGGGGGGYSGNYDSGFGGGGGGMMSGPPGGWAMHQNQQRDVESGMTQPPMMTFKQFLASQDDGIDDQEAVKKYNEYKLEFKRQQINEFFVAHKEEEWFRVKYHPEESTKRKGDVALALKRRLDIFMEFFEKGSVDPVRIDQENSGNIVRFLDAVVIKLEGGTDFDLKSLEDDFVEEEKKEKLSPVATEPKTKKEDGEEEEQNAKESNEEKSKSKRRKTSRDSNFVDNDESSAASDSDSENETQADEDNEDEDNTNDKTVVKEESEKDESRKNSESLSEKEGEEEPAPASPLKEEPSADKDTEDTPEEGATENDDSVVKEEGEEKIAVNNDADDKKDDEESEKEDGEEVDEEEKTVKVDAEEEEKKDEEMKDETLENGEVPKEPRPRSLHKTCSIFLRYLAPTVTKLEVEAVCKRFPGFLRVAIADPQPERRFVRRAWVTFEKSVNIKEMCWNLNGIRLRDNELGAIVNRDLSRRIRSVNGISSHKQVVRADIKLAARIIQNLDRQKKMWDIEDESEVQPDQGFQMVSKNPLLKNITDYLIEEASAEEEELLGMPDQAETKEEGFSLERDETLIQVLDRLLLYLRVVHSVDYYNSSEYPSEDEMPNRCGIMHARGLPPSSKVLNQEISEYISHFEQKSQSFLQMPTKLEDDESQKLGKKDPETEMEKFIQANSQELSKEKWLCPLSGKKFKGPEFVRKHIFNKHSEKIDEVKKEVEYFNNYLMDSRRPQLPEHPSNRPAGGAGGRSDMVGNPNAYASHYVPPPPPYGFAPRGHSYGGYQNYGRGPDMYRGGGFGKRNNFNRRNPRSDPRKIITYRDLDAPNDMDVF